MNAVAELGDPEGIATYREWRGVAADDVRCLWAAPASAGPQPVVPDGCLDLIWRHGQLFVAGPDTQLVVVPQGGPTVGVRFRPGRAGAALGLSPRDLLDERAPLADLWGLDAERLHEQLIQSADAVSAAQHIANAVAFRLSCTRGSSPCPDPIAAEAVRRIEGAQGRVRVSLLAAELQIGERQLRERVTTQVGYGPKMFARVVRLQAALRALHREPADLADLADLAQATGFADQAHLTREVHAMTGLTPGEHRAEIFKTPSLGSTT